MSKQIHTLSGLELVNAVRECTSLHDIIVPELFIAVIEDYGISVLRVHEILARQEAWAAEMGEVIIASSTEHQQHDAMYQFWEENVVYGSTPKEAVFRCVVKRFNKEYR